MDELDKFTSRLLLMILGFLFVAFVSVIAVNIIGAQLFTKIAWALGALIVIVFLSLRKKQIYSKSLENIKTIKDLYSQITGFFKRDGNWLLLVLAFITFAVVAVAKINRENGGGSKLDSSDKYESCAPRC